MLDYKNMQGLYVSVFKNRNNHNHLFLENIRFSSYSYKVIDQTCEPKLAGMGLIFKLNTTDELRTGMLKANL